MAQENRAALIAKWKAGYRPTQQDYANLFESIFNLLEYGEKPGLMHLRASYDASSNQFPSTGGSGESGVILAGNLFPISVGGTLGGEAVVAGQAILALIDNPGQTASNWVISAKSTSSYPSISDNGIVVEINANLIVNKQAHGGSYVKSFSASAEFNANNGNNQYMEVTASTTISIVNELPGTFIIDLLINTASAPTITIGPSIGAPYDNNPDIINADGDMITIMIYVNPNGSKKYTINTITA